MTVYNAKIVEIGEEAYDDEALLILFRNDAAEELRPYCVLHDGQSLDGEIHAGQRMILGENTYTVTAVGSVANKNLNDLGHVSLCFSGSSEANNPGDICLNADTRPTLKPGESIRIEE